MKSSCLCLVLVTSLLMSCGEDRVYMDEEDEIFYSLYSVTCDEVICHDVNIYNLFDGVMVQHIGCFWDCATFGGDDDDRISMVFKRTQNPDGSYNYWKPYTDERPSCS